MKLKIMEHLREFQIQHCKGCLYAKNEKIGTGKACCTCPSIPRIGNNICFTRKAWQ